jgi:predicted ATPase/DNA-binding winged helix-turn-helix (wHTH) protein
MGAYATPVLKKRLNFRKTAWCSGLDDRAPFGATTGRTMDTYEVGPFQLDPEASLLTLSGVPVALGRRAIDVLTALVQSPQECVTKARLLDAAWPGLVVEESNLAVQISSLRRALAQVQGGERWIETLAGRGYRFIGPVRSVTKASSTPLAEKLHSLPHDVDTFVGRATAVQDLSSRFDAGVRIVSIVGTGGAGKTRLAQRFGWTSLSRFPGGVWFCDLSAAQTVDGIAHAVARGLDVPVSGPDPLAYLSRVISERGECLVILDNFEQVARHAGETLVHWAQRAPKARFLATTRELLGVPGEHALTLGPLDTEDATTLFLQRAGATEATFTPTADDQPAIVRITELLDCLPLAIELAAARVRVMSFRSLLQRMDHDLSMLASGRGRPQRHASLRATFDWSWDLLDPRERTALAQLSVFEGGFTLEAAEALVDLSAFEGDSSTVDLVQGLVEKSLVRRRSEHRFVLLDTIKAYASGRLETDAHCGGPNALRSARARHYRYFAALDEAHATAEQGVEIDNLVGACRRAVQDEDQQSAVGALVLAWEAFLRTGPYRGAVELAESVHSMSGLNDSQRAMVDWVAGMALFSLGRGGEAKLRFERGLAAGRAAGDRRAESLLLRGLGDELAIEGRIDEALAHAGEALAIAEALGNRSLECNALNRLGAALWRAGRLAAAKGSYTKALHVAREAGDRRMQGAIAGNLGIVHHDLGELDEARTLYEQSLLIALELGDRQGEAAERGNIAGLSLEQGRTDEARAQFETSLTIGRFLGHPRTEYASRQGLGDVLAAQGDLEAAREQHRHAAELAHEAGDRRSEGKLLSKLSLSLSRLGAHAEAQERFAAAEALLREVGDPASLVELYSRWAEAMLLMRDSARSAELIGRAENAALAAGSPRPKSLEAMLRRVRSLSSGDC